MRIELPIYNSRKQVTRIVFSAILFLFIFHWFSYGLISQLQEPVMKFISVDNTLWICHLFQFPQAIVQSKVLTIILEISLVFFLVAYIWRPIHRVLVIIFFLLFLFFFITFQSYSGSHNHGGLAILFLTIPFLFKKEFSFRLLFEGVRFYFLFSLVSAALWKLLRGNVFDGSHMTNLLKQQLAHKLSFNANGISDQISYFLISHSSVTQFMIFAVITIQLIFLVGFVTKKYDFYLILLTLLFFVSNIFIMNIFSVEYLLFLLALFPFSKNFSSFNV